MEKLINELASISLCPDLNTGDVIGEVNKLFDINLKRDANIRIRRFCFNQARHLGPSVISYLPEISADYEDRINVMSEIFEWIPDKPEILEKFTKNREVSAAFRFKANELLDGKRDIQKAMKLFNLAIMFAEPSGEELGLAFANRSVLLLQQQDPEGALKDIDLAMKHNYPERLKQRLEKRREKCVKMLEESEPLYLTEDIKADIRRRRKYIDELLKLKNPNPVIPCAENFVDIKHSDKVGRQLVVNQDVPAGTVVIVERPFISVNKGMLKFESNHCDHCYKFLKNGIPCKQCVFAMYCSEACRSNAEFGNHKFECSCLSSLYLRAINHLTLLAFRVVCKVGPEEFYRLFTTRDPNYFDSKKPFGTEPSCKYESDSYLPTHHLVSHPNTLDKISRYSNGLYALELMSILEARTNFFQISPEENRKEFKTFIAVAFLHLMEAMPCNAMTMEELKGLQGRTLAYIYRLKNVEGTIKEVIKDQSCYDMSTIGVYAVGSLLNHSCDASVVRVFDASQKTMVAVTVRALKKGEPLTTSYGPKYEDMNLLERQSILMHHYRFMCQCVACRNDWPNYVDLHMRLRNNLPQLTCPHCSRNFSHEEKCSSEFLKTCLKPGYRTTCGLCARSYKAEELNMDLMEAEIKLCQSSSDVFSNRPLQVVKAYKEVSEYYQFNCRPPHGATGMLREDFQRALDLILHFAD